MYIYCAHWEYPRYTYNDDVAIPTCTQYVPDTESCNCFQGTQGKSPYPNSSSPLPSPASVGSTTSTGSGGWTATQDPSPSGSATVPKHIVNKATEHLTISGYVSNSVELWKTSESLMSQYRGVCSLPTYIHVPFVNVAMHTFKNMISEFTEVINSCSMIDRVASF